MKYALESMAAIEDVRQHISNYHDAILEKILLVSQSQIQFEKGSCDEYLSGLWDLEIRLKKCDHSPPGPTVRNYIASFKDAHEIVINTADLHNIPDTSVTSASIDADVDAWRFSLYIGERVANAKPIVAFLFSSADFEE